MDCNHHIDIEGGSYAYALLPEPCPYCRIAELEADRDALGDELHDTLRELVAVKAEPTQEESK
jgi:hypothetical protein